MNPAAAKSDLMIAANHADVFSKLKRRRVVLAEGAVVCSRRETVCNRDPQCRGFVQIRLHSKLAQIRKIRGLLDDIASIDAAAKAGDGAGPDQVGIAKNKLIYAKR